MTARDPLPLPPLTAAQLARVREQMRTGRAEWQSGTGTPVTRIPVERYASEAIRGREIERLFRSLPLIVGHASELPPGHVLANDDHDVPMLLARDAGGRFHAFLNVCRHRGMRLVETSGAATARPSVVCPYHAWTYALDGQLRHRLHAESFDDGGCREATDLVALPAEERHGLLWVVPTPGAAIDVAAWLDAFDAELPFYGVGALQHFRTVRAEYDANWKLIVDAFLEAYHIRVLHRDTIWPFFADGITASDRVGPHVQSLVARRAAQEWARDDGDVSAVDFARLCKLATPTHVLFPNAVFIFHPDYLSVITLHPVSAGRLRWIHRMLIPPSKSTPDWMPHWEKTFTLMEQGVFQKEDIACAVGIQRGFASGANTHLSAGRAEHGIGFFHDEVARRLA